MVREILRPETIREAQKARARPGAAYLGGGTWLNANHGAAPTTLISLEKLGLASIETRASVCRIGAGATFQQLVDDPAVPEAVRAAAAATASRTLRNMVTVGGELGLRPPDSALIPVLVVLEAEVVIAGRRRPVPILEWSRGRSEDLVLGVLVQDSSQSCAVRCVSRTSHSRRSLVVAASVRAARPFLSGVRVALSDCEGQLLRLVEAEERLEGKPLPPKAEIEAIVRHTFAPRPDLHASPEFKGYLAGVLAADLLHALSARGA